MKILHYISHFSFPSETFIYDLINNLEDNGLDNYVLTHNREMEGERPFSKVKIISENTSFVKKVYSRLFEPWQIRNKKDVFKYIEKLKPDLIHAHFGPNGVKIANLIDIYKLKIPIVISMHGTDTTFYPLKYTNYRKKLLNLSQQKSILFTFPSKFLKEEFEKNVNVILSNNAFVMPNSFNEIFNNRKNTYFKYGEKLKLVSIGRLIKLKGFNYLIEAVNLLDKYYSNWELSIIGDGELKDELIKYAKELGVLQKIKFYGFVEHNKVSRILIDSDIYIQPSIVDLKTKQAESFGVAVIEAIMSGLPVVVSDVGGLPDTVLGGHKDFAKIVKQQNANEIYKAILEIIDNNGDNNIFRNDVEQTYSRQKQLHNLLNIYTNMENKC